MWNMTKHELHTGRTVVSSSAPWEAQIGYSRALRVGNLIFVAGTVAADEQGAPVGTTAAQQTDYILRKISSALEKAGGSLRDVVRVDAFLVNFADFDGYADVHRRHFGEIRPVNTTVQCAALVTSAFLVEISALAVVGE